MKLVNIPIKKLHPDAVIPFYAREGDAGMDLVAVHDATVFPGGTVVVKTGIAMAIPPGYELQVRPRSGMSLNTKIRIANSPGTIDSNFRGEIGIIIDNNARVDYQEITIRKGDRIAQAVLNEVPKADFQEVDDLDETVRGTAGYGSSGSRI